MNLQNREDFLNKLAAKMGRPRELEPQPMEKAVNDYPQQRLTDLSDFERAAEFVKAAQAMATDVVLTKEADITKTLLEVCEKYGGGEVILSQDPRLEALGIPQALAAHYPCHTWSPEEAHENVAFAEKANIGIVHAEYGLAETGGIVLFSSKDRGRSVSLLPEKSIVVLRQSQVIPRVAQLANVLHNKAQLGERMPSCVNIISGPSSTADIELIKVVGVHGPVSQIYVVIEDL